MTYGTLHNEVFWVQYAHSDGSFCKVPTFKGSNNIAQILLIDNVSVNMHTVIPEWYISFFLKVTKLYALTNKLFARSMP